MNEPKSYLIEIAGQMPDAIYERALQEVVRCRDCMAYAPFCTNAGTKLDYGECMQHRRQTDDDRFCWWAERKEHDGE